MTSITICDNKNADKIGCDKQPECMYFSYNNKCVANCKYIGIVGNDTDCTNNNETCEINEGTKKCDYIKTTSGITRYIWITIFILVLIGFRHFRHIPLFNYNIMKHNILLIILLGLFIPTYIAAFSSIAINKGHVYQRNTILFGILFGLTVSIQILYIVIARYSEKFQRHFSGHYLPIVGYQGANDTLMILINILTIISSICILSPWMFDNSSYDFHLGTKDIDMDQFTGIPIGYGLILVLIVLLHVIFFIFRNTSLWEKIFFKKPPSPERWEKGLYVLGVSVVIGFIILVIKGFISGNNPDCFNLDYNGKTKTLVPNSSNCKSLKEISESNDPNDKSLKELIGQCAYGIDLSNPGKVAGTTLSNTNTGISNQEMCKSSEWYAKHKDQIYLGDTKDSWWGVTSLTILFVILAIVGLLLFGDYFISIMGWKLLAGLITIAICILAVTIIQTFNDNSEDTTKGNMPCNYYDTKDECIMLGIAKDGNECAFNEETKTCYSYDSGDIVNDVTPSPSIESTSLILWCVVYVFLLSFIMVFSKNILGDNELHKVQWIVFVMGLLSFIGPFVYSLISSYSDVPEEIIFGIFSGVWLSIIILTIVFEIEKFINLFKYSKWFMIGFLVINMGFIIWQTINIHNLDDKNILSNYRVWVSSLSFIIVVFYAYYDGVMDYVLDGLTSTKNRAPEIITAIRHHSKKTMFGIIVTIIISMFLLSKYINELRIKIVPWMA